MNLFEFDNDALIYSQTSAIEESYKELFNKIFNGINTESYTPQGQLITALSEIDSDTIAKVSEMVTSFFLGGKGAWLDNYALTYYGITRKQATPSQVMVTIQANNGVIIPKGFLVSDGVLNYENLNDIKVTDNGSITICMPCTQITNKQSLANTITKILTPLNGVFRVNNANNSIAGQPIESDSDLQARCLNYGSVFKNNTLGSIISNVANLQGVLKVNGADNVANTTQNINQIAFNAHSVGLVVLGGNDYEIANMIRNTKPPCVNTSGNTAITLKSEFEEYQNNESYNQVINFFRPTLTPLQFSVSIKLNNYNAFNFSETIQNAIINYINGLEIGDTITYPNIINAIIEASNNDFTLLSLKFSRKTQAPNNENISLNFIEMATIEASDITIENE